MSRVLAVLAVLAGAACATLAGSGGAPVHPGERLYRIRCTQCHARIDPASRSPEAWTRLLSKYGEVANLPDEERRLILAYLRGEPDVPAPAPRGP